MLGFDSKKCSIGLWWILLVSITATSSNNDITHSSAVYWWKYHSRDCNKDDVTPQPACSKTVAWGDVAGLERCCLSTPGCAGFNTHNVIKASNCSSRVGPAPCDLYLKKTEPQPSPPPTPPTPPPYPAPPSQRQSVGLWPLPRNVSSGDIFSTRAWLAPDFIIVVTRGQTASLRAIVGRYNRLILLHGLPAPPPAASSASAPLPTQIHNCTINVASTTERLQLGMDESYTLSVEENACTIAANTFVGALYGLETFSQLVLSNGTGAGQHATYWIPHLPWRVEDAPRFQYRGLMVDTARHFLPLNALRRQIDAMSFSKMNFLHWHLTDAQSTPFDSARFPLLKRGAFTPRHTYTPGDLRAIVEYARERGVQVLVEVDMPGHNYAFGIGYPELIVNCSKMYPLETQFWTSSFALYREEVIYSFLEKFLGELTELLPNQLFHIGGDEVQYQCWSTDPAMVAYLSHRNMTQRDLYREFETRVFSILGKLGRTPVFWNSVFDSGVSLPTGAVVHSYQGGSAAVARIAEAGHRVITSGLRGDYVASQAPWTEIFSEEIMPANLNAAAQARVLGAATAMWGETMDDSDIDTIVWPDTAALAERLWSSGGDQNPAAYDAAAATMRMIPHRCRLYQRGIRAKTLDDRDGFGRRRLQAQCETLLPYSTGQSLPPLSAQSHSEL